MQLRHRGGNLVASVEDALGLGAAAEHGGGKDGAKKKDGNFHTVN